MMNGRHSELDLHFSKVCGVDEFLGGNDEGTEEGGGGEGRKGCEDEENNPFFHSFLSLKKFF